MQNTVRLTGERICLTAFRRDEEALRKYMEWVNNEELVHYIGKNNTSIREDQERKYLDEIPDTKMIFNIVPVGKTEIIGNCFIDVRSNGAITGRIGIVIGSSKDWYHGFGTEAIKLLLKFGFEECACNNINLTVLEDNKHAIEVYEGVGFRKMGTLRNFAFHGGKYRDLYYMDITDDEYFDTKVKNEETTNRGNEPKKQSEKQVSK